MKGKKEELAYILMIIGFVWAIIFLLLYKQIYLAIPGLIFELLGVYIIVHYRIQHKEFNKMIPSFISLGLVLGILFVYVLFIF